MTRDPRDPSFSWPMTRLYTWPMTQSQSMTWVDHDYHESWWDHSYCLLFSAMVCNLEFWIWLMQCIFLCTVSLVVYTLHGNCNELNTVEKLVCLTSYMFTPHLIMGQVFYGTGLWPTWPIHICWPIWLMTHDPLIHCLHCRCDSRVGGSQTMVLNTETGLKCVRISITFIFCMSHTTTDRETDRLTISNSILHSNTMHRMAKTSAATMRYRKLNTTKYHLYTFWPSIPIGPCYTQIHLYSKLQSIRHSTWNNLS